MAQASEYNQLKSQESLYLKQHANQPVNWLPYGPEALLKAKEENRPILLSIGYSSCHWCHVMSHESFEDEATAKLLNDTFVCIKVDKEEYPDLDTYYQACSQAFTKTGGWPLNAFLLPDLKPFFVGTYFSKEKQGEAPTFVELITELSRAYKDDRPQIEENAKNVTELIEKGVTPPEKIDFPDHFPHPMAIMGAIKDFRDLDNGGFGKSPKFFNYGFFEWATEQILEGMIEKKEGQFIVDSVEKLLMGGIFDQVKGGIHRYAVDEKWLTPHFEKMLYDQPGLLKVMAKSSLIYPSPLIYDGLMNTLHYLESEMLSEKGYFFSAQDSDSEGVEGLYFTYTLEEFEDAIKSDESIDMDKAKKWFQVSKDGNFHGKLNILSMSTEHKDELYQSENWDMVRKIRGLLLATRKTRIPPRTDNKGVASWNFMVLSSLADVVQYCQIDNIKRKALDLVHICIEGMYKEFIVSKDKEKMTIRHATTINQSATYLEDYVFFAESQLRIYEITANQVFKSNFIDTLKFITKEFIKDDAFMTRSINEDESVKYPNLKLHFFDNSFKSPSATAYSLLRRANALFPDEDFSEIIKKLNENISQEALANPLSSGEALRALSYPDHAYRILKVPADWAKKDDYLRFISFFLSRFVIDYQEEKESEAWQICNATSCEIKGEGLENFMKTLSNKDKPES